MQPIWLRAETCDTIEHIKAGKMKEAKDLHIAYLHFKLTIDHAS